ncbi:NAD(P)/FAD-dependent oxidoreductase [Roseovarius sp. D22-M7]|uniref:NAD(P)/FAD-dependent oxidoreductase n=1 Tax=Roseovarius sp. D22-M7 TaxID=3127116 RepID=UPI00300FBA18
MIDTVVVGGGMTGISCARALSDAGREVLVLDKGRGLGGRMATRRVTLDGKDATFDHGAQYIGATAPDVAAMLDGLPDASAEWHDGAARPHHVGLPGMSGLPRALAQGIETRQGTNAAALHPIPDGWRITTDTEMFEAARVVLTIPAPQVAGLIGADHPLVTPLKDVTMDPCLTLMAAFPRNAPRPFISRVDPDSTLAWIAQDSTKPGRADHVTTWIAQAAPGWSLRHVDDAPEDIAARMLPLLCAAIGTDPDNALYAAAHRWRYAHVATALNRDFLRSDDARLYLGGDWCLGPRVEAAWQSGTAIARDILERNDAG